MAPSKSLPDYVVSVATYSEFEHYARAFADGHLNLLMLRGDPRLCKSQFMRHALRQPAKATFRAVTPSPAQVFHPYCDVIIKRWEQFIGKKHNDKRQSLPERNEEDEHD
jgi:hypothetical protein